MSGVILGHYQAQVILGNQGRQRWVLMLSADPILTKQDAPAGLLHYDLFVSQSLSATGGCFLQQIRLPEVRFPRPKRLPRSEKRETTATQTEQTSEPRSTATAWLSGASSGRPRRDETGRSPAFRRESPWKGPPSSGMVCQRRRERVERSVFNASS